MQKQADMGLFKLALLYAIFGLKQTQQVTSLL